MCLYNCMHFTVYCSLFLTILQIISANKKIKYSYYLVINVTLQQGYFEVTKTAFFVVFFPGIWILP